MVKRNNDAASAAIAGVLAIGTLVVAVAVLAAPAAADGGYMDATVVREEVQTAIGRDSGVGAALIRLLFHDCWVNGCDGSVLLNSSSGMEREAAKNIGLRGFNVVDAIKARLPKASCADIVVFAAREAVYSLSRGSIDYAVEAGRKDGVVSSAAAAEKFLPGSTASFADLKKGFADRGFSVEDLVVLSGAHAVGVCHRSSFQDRLTAPADQIDPHYQHALETYVDLHETVYHEQDPTAANNVRDMGVLFQTLSGYDAAGVDTAAAGVLDNSYYHANLQNMVLLRSDWVLRTDGDAAGNLTEYSDKPAKWNSDFGKAMARLSDLKPAPGTYSDKIRTSCSRIAS